MHCCSLIRRGSPLRRSEMIGAFGEVVHLADNGGKSKKAEKEKAPKKQKGKRVSFAAGKGEEQPEAEEKAEESQQEEERVHAPVPKKGKQREVCASLG